MSSSTTVMVEEQDDENWDRPFTAEELAAIDDAVLQYSATTSSSKRQFPSNDSDGLSDKVSRRRLPDSLFTFQQNGSTAGSCLRKSTCPAIRYPEISFRGRIVYSRSFDEVEKSAAELLNFVEAKRRTEGQAILGFDIEWRPTFRRGIAPGKSAVLQICGDSKVCYVMHIHHSGIPQNLRSLLESPTSLKVGVCIANDARKMFSDHSVWIKDLEDLSYLANQKLGGDCKNWSLSSLTEMLICKQLPKPHNIRLGNWEANVLSDEQLKYAATDAFVSWYLFQVLKSLPEAEISQTDKEPVAAAPK
ncbi:OLC1v1018975C1 [Oldenlandia corymbosa var. corymbosa]|uniref:3'-5' exonuclease n=1 Tax=Oldenlandia corymbosa var. corymbosa TaxID=529605 RepID=A0AAV1ECZ1_OLDCO|nr:OLC1v1018975C1 [Oldenlandia corymbosa var. corymbosa]